METHSGGPASSSWPCPRALPKIIQINHEPDIWIDFVGCCFFLFTFIFILQVITACSFPLTMIIIRTECRGGEDSFPSDRPPVTTKGQSSAVQALGPGFPLSPPSNQRGRRPELLPHLDSFCFVLKSKVTLLRPQPLSTALFPLSINSAPSRLVTCPHPPCHPASTGAPPGLLGARDEHPPSTLWAPGHPDGRSLGPPSTPKL